MPEGNQRRQQSILCQRAAEKSAALFVFGATIPRLIRMACEFHIGKGVSIRNTKMETSAVTNKLRKLYGAEK
jgi:hypothetical protein